MTQYRVRLLQEPIIVYNGHSYELATEIMDDLTCDRVLEHRTREGWKYVVSVEVGTWTAS